MFLEGEVNWVLVLGVVSGVACILAILGLIAAGRWAAASRNATARLDHLMMNRDGSDRRLREVLDAIPVALVETDAGGKFIFANRAAHALLGRKDAELLGLRFHSATWGVTYPDGRPIPPDLLPSARALRGQTVKGFQHVMANPSTRAKMLVSVTAMPILNGLGEVIGSTAAIVETDSLIQPEPAPAPAEAVPSGPHPSRRAFESAPEALVVLDRHGRVLEANRAALALGGAEADTIQGLDFADLFLTLEERAEGRMALNAARAGGADSLTAASGARWRILPLDDDADGGESGALLLAAEPPVPPPPPEIPLREDERVQALTDELDQARALAATLQDRIQEREAEIQSARRLETVGRLTGGVAHDFASLLTVMTSALDMLLKQADQPERVRRLASAALNAGRRGENLTRRLSAFSRGEDALAARLDLGVLLRAMEPALRDLAGPGVDLMIEAPETPMEAIVDPVAFDGAVRALTQNAALAVDGRGSIAVRIQTTEGGELRLSVRDDGPGMDVEALGRAPEPFFTTRPGAAGLGLSQAYAFARMSGGRLILNSTPGEGAEAVVVLPAAAPEAAAADETIPTPLQAES